MELLFNYPEYAEVDGKKYKINTDYKIALRCNQISMNQDINIIEKNLAIIYLLYGEEGLKSYNHYQQLIEKAIKYLQCGIEDKNEGSKQEPDMDFIQDMPYIEASFMSDYNINLENTKMHWWKFYHLINGLSNSEMGSCCILNRIRNIRTTDLKEIKDPKLRKKMKEAKDFFALKKIKKEKTFTEQELKNMEEYHKLIEGKEQ